jgi:hypothetical protein
MALSEKIHNILKSREKIKSKIRQNQMEEMQVNEEITKLAPIIQEPVVREMQQQHQLQPFPEIYPSLSALEAPPVKKRKMIDLDPDKDIDQHLVKGLKLYLPSELLTRFEEAERNDIISGSLERVNTFLRSLGGKKRSESKSGEISQTIDSLRNYKEALKSLQKIPRFQVPQFGAGDGDPCKRLELLVASRAAGNDNNEIVKEAKSILNLLLKRGQISKSNSIKILNKWFY